MPFDRFSVPLGSYLNRSTLAGLYTAPAAPSPPGLAAGPGDDADRSTATVTFERIAGRWGLLQQDHLHVPTSHVLFATYRDGVFRYLSRIVGATEASDLTQEVFLRVSRSNAPATNAEEQRAWVFRIARNLALNHHRDTDRRPRLVALVDTPAPASQEDTVAVREALAQLAPLDRDVFLLREVAGLSYGEISAACELSADAVRSRLHRARQQLRVCLSPASRRRVGVQPLNDHDQH